jgi:hypothetical protein
VIRELTAERREAIERARERDALLATAQEGRAPSP